MQRVCPKCNTLVTSDGSFCPSCGEPLPAAVDLGKKEEARSVQYSVPAQDEHQGTIPNYGYSPQIQNVPPMTNNMPYAANNQEMTLGQWVGTVICTTWLGIISIVLCIVWGFSNDVPLAKKRYCQAMLIIQIISTVVGIIFAIIFGAILANSLPDIIEALEEAVENNGVNFHFAA